MVKIIVCTTFSNHPGLRIQNSSWILAEDHALTSKQPVYASLISTMNDSNASKLWKLFPHLHRIGFQEPTSHRAGSSRNLGIWVAVSYIGTHDICHLMILLGKDTQGFEVWGHLASFNFPKLRSARRHCSWLQRLHLAKSHPLHRNVGTVGPLAPGTWSKL